MGQAKNVGNQNIFALKYIPNFAILSPIELTLNNKFGGLGHANKTTDLFSSPVGGEERGPPLSRVNSTAAHQVESD